MRQAIKRKIIQWTALAVTNIHFPNFLKGTIDKGASKRICVPGLNCYSCPGAAGACPLGALQSVQGSVSYRISFYVIGLLMAFGLLLGRFICGFLCPFGLFQELLHKIPVPHIKLKRIFTYVKYILLAVFVIILPIMLGAPAFCKYICPAGTLEGGIPLLLGNPLLRGSIGGLFFLKLSILLLTIAGCLFIYRFFCRVLCPLGAIYALFNRISFYQLQLDQDACIDCGKCKKVCKMGVDPSEHPNDPECIRCGDCVSSCKTDALQAGFRCRK